MWSSQTLWFGILLSNFSKIFVNTIGKTAVEIPEIANKISHIRKYKSDIDNLQPEAQILQFTKLGHQPTTTSEYEQDLSSKSAEPKSAKV